MHNKNVKQSRIHRLFGIKVKSKLAAAYMDTAVKILICVVCGALFLTGIYGVIQKVVLPKTESSVTSMFAYESADAGNGGGAGGSGGVETPDVNEEYEMLDGADQTFNTGAIATPLTFRSSAPIDTFQEVKVDGETVDGSNYTVTEGSTIVTFTSEYAKTLASGDHTVEIVSNDGSAKTNFEISNLIPENATYTRADGTVLNAGSEFPEIALGDVYKYGDYEYHYGYQYCMVCETWSNECGDNYITTDGWFVHYNNNSLEPGSILESINDVAITSLHAAFYRASINSIPKIPNGVKKLDYAFVCSSIEDASNLVISNNVTSMISSFDSCYNLKYAPEIPNSVTQMSSTFAGCTSLVLAPEIPENVSDITAVFSNCSSLPNSITINSSPTYYDDALRGTRITEILGNCRNKDVILATK